MTRTTPPRPADIVDSFPELAPLARTATRLHPHPGMPTPDDSSVGGPLLWPAREPWPHCAGPHWVSPQLPARSPADVRLLRRIQADARRRPPGGPMYTEQEREAVHRIKAGRPTPTEPVAMLALAQLYTRDVPDLQSHDDVDLLQVLWCPFHHGDENMPKAALFWRSARTVNEILTAPPQPEAVKYDGYVPEPCLLQPEQVVEYPAPTELEEELRERVEEWSARQKAGAAPGSLYDGAEDSFYDRELSVAPGWKVGGWPPWSVTDPWPLRCTTCGTLMRPLLTIASYEWQPDGPSWIPHEDQAASSTPATFPDPATPTMIIIPGGYNQQIYTCQVSREHPHTALLQ